MIVTRFYKGQGLGNQLWAYVVTRTVAEDNGYEYGFGSVDKFKGHSFLDLDFGKKVEGDWLAEYRPRPKLPRGVDKIFIEKSEWSIRHGCDVTDYDPSIFSVADNTFLSGYFQSEKYIEHRKNEICKWLKVDEIFNIKEFSDDDLCILNVRGGEYKNFPELILGREYWINAMENMRKLRPHVKFLIVTDDLKYAASLLPEIKAYHFTIGGDYSIINNAKNLILSNSSFAFFPAWTNLKLLNVIAPRYWARHNISDGYWACAFNIYRNWLWQDRSGVLFSYEDVIESYEKYKLYGRAGVVPSPNKEGSLIKNVLVGSRDNLAKVKRKLFNE